MGPVARNSSRSACRLRDQRLGAVEAVLKGSGARRVLDLGCGPGALLERLLRGDYERIVGVDVSVRALEQAARRLKLDAMHDAQRRRIELLHSPLTYRDKRLVGFDAAALVEVIEHLDPPRLSAAEQNVFASARPATVVVTTPNAEYNVMWETLPAGQFRHPDHRFEWTRSEFTAWASGVAERHGYTARYLPVGPEMRGSDLRRRWPCSLDEDRSPDPGLVVLIGPSGSGKSSFAGKHFAATEVISSDFCRGLVADDENDQSARRPTRSRCCTSSPADALRSRASPSSTPPTCSARRASR
ncbi:MAG: methyltransferase domain-containing protein [Solirubrobacterales bacterium]